MTPMLRLSRYQLVAIVVQGLILCALSAIPMITASDSEDLTEIPLEDLNKLEVYSASKFNQKASEAPASIDIVTAADISRFGYRTFDDILRSVPGFFVTYDRNYAFLGVRGFGLPGDYNTRILTLIDGHRLNENIYSSIGVGTDFPIPMDLIQRIEIVRGPGSSLYGTNAFLAVINVITKRGRDFNGGGLSLEAGSRQTYQGTAIYGQQFANGLEILLSSAYMDSKGERRLYYKEFDTPESNNGIAQDGDTNRSDGFFADVSYKDFSARLVYQSRGKRYPTASFGTIFNDRRNNTTDTRAYLELKFDHKFRDNWSLLARSSLDAYEFRGIYMNDYSDNETPNIIANEDLVSGRWWNSETQVTRVFGNRHHLTAGTEMRYNFRALQQNSDQLDHYLYLDSNPSSMEAGVYLQGEIALRENLLMSAGVRYDHYSTFGGSVNPRFALVYSPWEKTTAKLVYGHAYRAPSVYEMFYADSNSSKQNPNLHPENIHTLELVLEQYLTRKIRLSGSGYLYGISQQIIQQVDSEDERIVFENFGSVGGKGLEVQLEGKDISGIDARLSYMHQSTEDKNTGASLPNSPSHMAQLKLYFPTFRTRGGAGLEMQYMSSRQTLRNDKVGGFLLTNLTLSYKNFLPGLDVSAGLYNLFNRQHSDPGSGEHLQDSIAQDGRSFRVRLGYRFHGR